MILISSLRNRSFPLSRRLNFVKRNFFSTSRSNSEGNGNDFVTKLFLKALDELKDDQIFKKEIEPKAQQSIREKTLKLNEAFKMDNESALKFEANHVENKIEDGIEYDMDEAKSLIEQNWDEVYRIKEKHLGYGAASYPGRKVLFGDPSPVNEDDAKK